MELLPSPQDPVLPTTSVTTTLTSDSTVPVTLSAVPLPLPPLILSRPA